jgi:hypothetical protein
LSEYELAPIIIIQGPEIGDEVISAALTEFLVTRETNEGAKAEAE